VDQQSRVHRVIEERASAIDGVEILEHRRHGNKLKTGISSGKRFTIVVARIDPADLDAAARPLDRIASEGVPNAFGVQRFGRDGDTHERARAWLTGNARPQRRHAQRRFSSPALPVCPLQRRARRPQSRRTWNIPVRRPPEEGGDGGMFVCTDVQLDRERADGRTVARPDPSSAIE
jgi:tRNA pseudouridine13 synthase